VTYLEHCNWLGPPSIGDIVYKVCGLKTDLVQPVERFAQYIENQESENLMEMEGLEK